MKINGYKTYIVGTALICYALGGLVAGKIDASAAIEAALLGLGMMGLRNSIPKPILSAAVPDNEPKEPTLP